MILAYYANEVADQHFKDRRGVEVFRCHGATCLRRRVLVVSALRLEFVLPEDLCAQTLMPPLSCV